VAVAWLCNTNLRRPALWQFRLGEGRLWVTSYAELFSNAALAADDNGRLLSNIVELAVGPGGGVIFDDMHQGRSSLYDPAAFFRDPRMHVSALLLLAIWLVYVLAYTNRFAPPPAPARGVTAFAFVTAVGGFYAGALDPREAARGLLRQFHADVRVRLHRGGNAPAWDLLIGHPAIAPTLLGALRAEQSRIESSPPGRSRDLRRLAMLIHQIRESLQ
jgi:hypothetical protein